MEENTISNLMKLLQQYEVAGKETFVFRDIAHDELIEAFINFIIHHNLPNNFSAWGKQLITLKIKASMVFGLTHIKAKSLKLASN